MKHLTKLGKVLFPSLIAVALIMIYSKYRCEHKDFKDPLETKLFVGLDVGLDGWSITHVTFFAILGYVYPEYFWYAIVLGTMWELFEVLYGRGRPEWADEFLGGYGGCDKLRTDREDGNWWYGKWSDIACNIIGFTIGVYLRKRKHLFTL